jgi:hypothetical protein
MSNCSVMEQFFFAYFIFFLTMKQILLPHVFVSGLMPKKETQKN